MLNEHIAYQKMMLLRSQQPHGHNFHLYALVDGLEYERLFKDNYEMKKNNSMMPLFVKPSNEDVAFAGPWLWDIEQLDTEWQNRVIELEKIYPSVSWLVSSSSFTHLFNNLERKLHLTLEGGRYALLRYYDPRVLNRLTMVLTAHQLRIFTLQIDEWVYYHNNHYHSLIEEILCNSQTNS